MERRPAEEEEHDEDRGGDDEGRGHGKRRRSILEVLFDFG
jgi:hypothetical protein